MDYKIVFSDIDGTLLNKERALSVKTIETIQKLKNKIPVILISARMPAAMYHLQEELGISHLPIIAYNGGLVLVDKKEFHSVTIPLKTLKKLHTFNTENNLHVHLSLYHHDEWYVPEIDFWANRETENTKISPQVKQNAKVIEDWASQGKSPHKIMAMGDEEKIDQIRDFLQENYGDQLHMYRSKKTYLEIANKDTSKFSAIQYLLANYYKIPTSEAIAYGDNYNDVEMIKNIGYGVAVSNARPEVLEHANKVTNHGKEDGVANSLTEIFKL